MRRVTKNLISLLLLIVLSGCSKSHLGPTALRQRGLQIQELMSNLQLFVVEVLDNNNRQCQTEVASNFTNMEIHHFAEHLFYTVGLKSVVGALHQAMVGDIDPKAIELIRSVDIDPAVYSTAGFINLLENTPQEEINNMSAELNVLRGLWSHCQETTPAAMELSDQEQVMKDLFIFWRDNMVTTTLDNNCQRQVKSRLSTNRTLIPFILNYYSLDLTLLPGFEPIDIDDQDVNIREEFETLKFIGENCEVEEETSEKTDFQNEAESFIKEMLTFWINNMIPFDESNNSCQRIAKEITESDDTLRTLITYLFSDTETNLIYYFNDDEEQFLSDMRQKLDILQNSSCL